MRFLDFSVWKIVKKKDFAKKPSDLQQLRAAITKEFEVLNNNKDLYKQIVFSVKKMLKMYTN